VLSETTTTVGQHSQTVNYCQLSKTTFLQAEARYCHSNNSNKGQKVSTRNKSKKVSVQWMDGWMERTLSNRQWLS